MSSTFTSTVFKTNTRALAYKDRILLSSCGSSIYFWHKSADWKCIQSFQLQLSQPIIGIKFEDDKLSSTSLLDHYDVLVYTTRFLVHCQLKLSYVAEKLMNFSLDQIFKKNLIYWIVDCVFGSNIAYILNSRNEVLIYDLNQQKVLTQIFGTQKCILYSGKFLQCSHNGLVIASGTVFKTILLWSLEIKDNRSCYLRNIQSLNGHDGVIFGVDYNQSHNIIVSASDDRTVRVWRSEKDLTTASSVLDLKFWEDNRFQQVHVHYGHSARIWKVASLSLDPPIAISTGEDSSIFCWSLIPPYTCLQKKSLARGTRIWSFEVLPEFIAFGGSDSAVKIIAIDDLLNSGEFSSFRVCLSIDQMKAVCYIDSHQNILAASKIGKLYLISKDGTCQFTLDQLFDCSDNVLRDYACLKNNPSQTKAIIASHYGHLGLLTVADQQIQCLHTLKPFDSKIMDMGFINDHQFICFTSTLHMKLFSVETDFIVENVCPFSLPGLAHSRFTCGLLTSDLLIIGDYYGSVSAYQTGNEKPVSQFLHVHGRNGVNSLKQKPLSKFVYSSGRNFRIFEYLITDSPRKCLNLLRTFTILQMAWIADFQFDSQAPFNLKYAYGFAGDKFLFWNVFENRIIFEDECGGGHRSFDVTIDSVEEKSNINLVYIKDNSLNIIKTSKPLSFEQSMGTTSFLPRHVNCCAHLPESHYFLIAGEDNVIQVIRFQNGVVQLCSTLHSHISAIFSLKCLSVHTEQPAIFAVSAGGRSQFVVWKFTFDKNKELICQERASNFLGTFSNHVAASNFTRKATKTSEVGKNHFESDIRYMNVDFCQTKSPDEYLILIACCDFSFRLFWYNDKERRVMKSEKRSFERRSCVLKANLIQHQSLAASICAFASTDGCLSLWPLGDATEPSIQFWQLHQAGINGIDFRFVNETLFVLTGGDDNALKLTAISINEGNVCHCKTVNLSPMHSCQISGLRFLSNFEFVSAGIDQKVFRWKVNLDNEIDNLEHQVVGSHVSSIADISSLEIISSKSNQLVLICGEGFELLSLKTNE